jgi:hypothetical protein
MSRYWATPLELSILNVSRKLPESKGLRQEVAVPVPQASVQPKVRTEPIVSMFMFDKWEIHPQ